MKRDEVLKIFPDATDEQVSSILNQVGSELNPLKTSLTDALAKGEESTKALSATQGELAAYKLKLDEANAKLQEGMTAEELLAQREREAAEKERAFVLKSNALDAKSIFVSSGYFEEGEIEALVEKVVSEDADGTKAFAQSIVDMVKKQRETTEQSTRNALLNSNPHLGGAAGANSVTKESFDKLTYAEKCKLLEENPDLLKSFESANPFAE